MPKDLCGSLGQCLKMLLNIREQKLERAAVMIMGHDSSRDAARAIRCGWHQGHRRGGKPDTSDP